MDKFKQIIISMLILLIGGGGSYAILGARSSSDGGASITPAAVMGTPAQFTRPASVYVKQASTSTDPITDGGIIQQEFNTNGANSIVLSGEGIGGTATSSIYFRIQTSIDGVVFRDITGYASTTPVFGTSTPIVSSPTVYSFDFGIASSTINQEITIPSAKKIRILVMEDNLSTDPNDGVKAFLQIGIK